MKLLAMACAVAVSLSASVWTTDGWSSAPQNRMTYTNGDQRGDLRVALDDKSSCEAIGGTWNAQFNCCHYGNVQQACPLAATQASPTSTNITPSKPPVTTNPTSTTTNDKSNTH